jgi:3-methylcrotonyl-CoA carboxylase alpha subunit
MNCDNHQTITFSDNGAEVAVTAHFRDNGYLLDLPGASLAASGVLEGDGSIFADLGGRRVRATVTRTQGELTIMAAGKVHQLAVCDPFAALGDDADAGGSLAAPMPGKIIAVLAEQGAKVERGTPLIIMEAMKMEHTISAPAAGLVVEIFYEAGDLVNEGAPLLEFAPAEG